MYQSQQKTTTICLTCSAKKSKIFLDIKCDPNAQGGKGNG